MVKLNILKFTWLAVIFFLPFTYLACQHYTSDIKIWLICGTLVVIVSMPLMSRTIYLKVWTSMNILSTVFIVLGILDMKIFNQNNYSGWGMIILVPVSLLVFISLLIQAIFITVTKNRADNK